jgi:hypothetical protein
MTDLVLLGIVWLIIGLFFVVGMDNDGLFDLITNRPLRNITKLILIVAWPTIMLFLVIGLLVLSLEGIISDIKRLFR